MKRKISDNLRRVKDRMANACIRAGRDPGEVSLVVVTKSVGLDVIRELLESGHCDLGESRVQELTRRGAMIGELRSRGQHGSSGDVFGEPRWHLVGHLQRNKVKLVLPFVEQIHSLDSLRLAEEISLQAEKIGKTISVLLQVNAAEESQKSGVAVGAVPHLAEQVATLPRIKLCGLMAMGPLNGDADRVSWTFERTKEIFDDMAKEKIYGPAFHQLSMGMSGDFEVAIEQGATVVRIGSAVFD